MRILSAEEAQCHLGDPNLHWDAPPYLLEPGDPGYLPSTFRPRPPGPTAPHLPLQTPATDTIPHHANPYAPTMQPFRYIIYLLNNLYTARPALREAVGGEEFLTILTARCGLPRAQVETVLRQLFALLVEYARQSIPVDFILGLFRMAPSVRGRYQSANPDAGAVRGNLDFSLIVHPSQRGAMQAGTPVEKTDERTETIPVVEGVHATPTGALLRYGVGQMAGTEADGEFFREGSFGATPPTVALVDANGANPIPLAVLFCTPTHLVLGGAPAGTTGPKFLKVTAGYGGHPFTVYTETLLPG
jgi:hypothetical protein